MPPKPNELSSMDQLSNDVELQKKQIEQLNGDLSTKKRELTNALGEIEKLKTQLIGLQNTVSESNKRSKDALESLTKLVSTVSAGASDGIASQHSQTFGKLISANTKKLEEATDDISKLQEEFSTLREHAHEVTARTNALVEHSKQVASTLDGMQYSIRSIAITEAQSALEPVKKMDSELKAVRDLMSKIITAVNELNGNIVSNTSGVSTNEKEISRVNAEIRRIDTELKTKVSSSTIESMREITSTLQSEVRIRDRSVKSTLDSVNKLDHLVKEQFTEFDERIKSIHKIFNEHIERFATHDKDIKLVNDKIAGIHNILRSNTATVNASVESLRTLVSKTQKSFTDATGDIKNNESAIDTLRAEFSSAVDGLNAHIADIRSLLGNRADDIEVSSNTIQGLRSLISKVQESNRDTQSDTRALQESFRSLQRTTDDSLKEYFATIRATQQDISTRASAVISALSDLSSFKSTVSVSSKKVESLYTTLTALEKKLNAGTYDTNKANEAVKERIKTAEDKIVKTINEVSELRDTIKQCLSRLDTQESTFMSIKDDLAAVEKITQDNVSQVVGMCDNVKTSIDDAVLRVTDIEHTMKNINGNISANGDKIKETDDKISDVKKTVGELNSAIKLNERAYIQEHSERIRAVDELQTSLNKVTESTENLFKQFSSNNEAIKKVTIGLSTDINRNIGNITELRKKLVSIEQNIIQDSSAVNSRITTASERIDALKIDISKLSSEISSNDAKVKECLSDVIEVRTIGRDIKTQMIEIRNSISTNIKEISEHSKYTKSAIEVLSTRISQNKKTFTEVKGEVGEFEKKINKVESSIDNFRIRLDDNRAIVNRFDSTLNGFRTQLTEIKSKFEESTKELSSKFAPFDSRFVQFETSISNISTEVTNTAAAIKSVHNNISELRSFVTSNDKQLDKKIDSVVCNVSNLNKELDELKKQTSCVTGNISNNKKSCQTLSTRLKALEETVSTNLHNGTLEIGTCRELIASIRDQQTILDKNYNTVFNNLIELQGRIGELANRLDEFEAGRPLDVSSTIDDTTSTVQSDEFRKQVLLEASELVSSRLVTLSQSLLDTQEELRTAQSEIIELRKEMNEVRENRNATIEVTVETPETRIELPAEPVEALVETPETQMETPVETPAEPPRKKKEKKSKKKNKKE